MPVNRYAYECWFGAIPDVLVVVNSYCLNLACVNPLHSEAVTHSEAFRRREMQRFMRELAIEQQEHCPNGHAYTADNLIQWEDGRRRCRTCDEERELRRLADCLLAGLCRRKPPPNGSRD